MCWSDRPTRSTSRTSFVRSRGRSSAFAASRPGCVIGVEVSSSAGSSNYGDGSTSIYGDGSSSIYGDSDPSSSSAGSSNYGDGTSGVTADNYGD